jgi:type I restriction enzyme, S subunit
MSSEWRATTLGKICRFTAGSAFAPDQQGSATGEHPFIKVSDMNLPGNEVFVRTANNYVTEAQRQQMKAKLHPASATVFAKIGVALTSNRRRQLVQPTIIDNNMMSAIANESEATSLFLYYLLITLDFNTIAAGTALPYLNVSDLQRMEVSIPNLDTQTEIERTLSALDDRIALLLESNATLEAIAQALFKSWFVDFDPVRAKQQGLAPAGMDEATVALFPDSFEDSALGLVPKTWGTGKVEDLLALAYGKALKATDRVAGDVPVYGSGGITGLHNCALVESPTVVVGRKGTVGSLYWEDRPCFPIDTVFYVQARVPLTFCYYQLRLLGLEGMNTDGAVPGLNRNNVYRLAVVIPPPPVISAFEEVAASLRSKIFTNEQQAQTLATLRDTLLPRLISGQLRLPEVVAEANEAMA